MYLHLLRRTKRKTSFLHFPSREGGALHSVIVCRCTLTLAPLQIKSGHPPAKNTNKQRKKTPKQMKWINLWCRLKKSDSMAHAVLSNFIPLFQTLLQQSHRLVENPLPVLLPGPDWFSLRGRADFFQWALQLCTQTTCRLVHLLTKPEIKINK